METKKIKKLLLAWLPVIILSSIILYQSAKPWPYIIKNMAYYDKAIHVFIYLCLAIFAARAFSSGKAETSFCHFIGAWIFASIFGAIDETIQHHFGSRKSDIFDWISDVAGSSLGIVLYWYWLYKIKKVKCKISTRDTS